MRLKLQKNCYEMAHRFVNLQSTASIGSVTKTLSHSTDGSMRCSLLLGLCSPDVSYHYG